MKFKLNDLVQVMRGKESGKQGKIVAINKAHTHVKIEGINIAVRHVKPSRGQPGEITKKEMLLDASNVMLVCPETKKPTRIGYTVDKNGRKVRISKKSGKNLDK
ncbi:50S ribosomal protein L24 [Candidatus Gracilibacteria bacterium CG17_big_fil_post_rev_8_21_14_2_50_48_13]|nr:MAG: 50S ribosomal protein L24 [Candidatus Gracilibacteria bacterium CG17_big_fil_post_rev_8_21_14_2_50_48_13]